MNVLKNGIANRPYITHISMFDDKRVYLQEVSESGEYIGISAPEILEMVKEKKGGAVWLPADMDMGYMYYGEWVPWISMIRNVNDLSVYTNVLAYMRICISEQYIADLYCGIANNSTLQLMIVRGDGAVISSMDKSMLGGSVAGEDFFAAAEDETFRLVGNRLVCACELESVDWKIIWIQDISQTNISDVINIMFVFLIALICIFVVSFMIIQQRTLIRPIQRLSRDVEAFRDETASIGIYRDTGDEVGRLNRGICEMSQRIHTLVEDGYKSQLREKKAQLQALQMQINPHFLYNTLESIRWMAYREKALEIAQQIEALSHLFRHVLNFGKDETTIADEVEHIRDYVLLQKNKYGDRLVYSCDADPELLGHSTLALILQPIVENSMVHGFENKLGVCRIEVSIFRRGDVILYRVTDNGVGVDEAEIRRQIDDPDISVDSFALSNIQKRIKYRYGNAWGLDFTSTPDVGTCVTIRFPYGGEEDETADRRG